MLFRITNTCSAAASRQQIPRYHVYRIMNAQIIRDHTQYFRTSACFRKKTIKYKARVGLTWIWNTTYSLHTHIQFSIRISNVYCLNDEHVCLWAFLLNGTGFYTFSISIFMSKCLSPDFWYFLSERCDHSFPKRHNLPARSQLCYCNREKSQCAHIQLNWSKESLFPKNATKAAVFNFVIVFNLRCITLTLSTCFQFRAWWVMTIFARNWTFKTCSTITWYYGCCSSWHLATTLNLVTSSFKLIFHIRFNEATSIRNNMYMFISQYPSNWIAKYISP